MPQKKSKGKKLLTLVLMILAMNTIYQLPYLMYYYYTPLQEAMGLVGRDADYGRLLNVYGIANVILYLPGGWIADKFSPKKLMVFSMVGTGVLGICESFFPSYELMMVIFVMFAVTTVLTFWSASVKCINMIADADEQGTMFGSLELGRNLFGLVVTTLFVTIFGIFSSNSTLAMSAIIRTCSGIMIAVGVLLAILMPESKEEAAAATNATLADSMKAFGKAFKHPSTYLLAGMIFAGSVATASASYYAPFLEQVFGLPTTVSVPFSTYRGPLCSAIGASIAAIMARKMKSSAKPMMIGATILGICVTVLALAPSTAAFMWPAFIIMIVATMAYSTLRALYYATIDESGVPKNIVGSIVGIASILGFLPDTFFTSTAGGWLDTYGTGGFKYIFLFCAGAAVLGLVCAFISNGKIKKHQEALAAAASTEN